MTERSPGRTILALVLSVLVVSAPGAAAGAPRAQTTPAGVLDLRRQTTWWRAGEAFNLEIAVQATAAESLEVAVSIFRKVPNRTEFATTAKGTPLGRAIEEIPPLPLAALPATDDGARVVSFTPTVRTSGVYPVQVELRPIGARAGRPVDSFLTHLVHVPAELPGDQLAVGLVLPVHAPPAVQPDGGVAIDDARAEQLAELADTIAGQPAVGLTIAATPETVEALAASPRDEDRSTMTTLAQGLGPRQLLGGPYVPTNVTSVLQAGLRDESAAQLNRGTATLRRLFERQPTTDTRIVDERLTEDAIAFLQGEQQVRRLVIPESLLESVPRRTTLTNTFEIEGRGERVSAAMADAGLTAHFNDRHHVLGAQRLLADLAVLYNDDPSTSRRGVVIHPPRTWDPSSAFAETLLAGLAASPILQSVTLDQLFDSVMPATSGTRARVTPLLRSFSAPPPGSPVAPSLPASAIRSARRQVEAFASAVEPSNPVLDRLDRTVLTASSIDLRPRLRTRYLEGLRDQLDAEVSKIAMPQARSITLTAREGEIPVTITSNVGYPLRAVLRVESDTLEFPDGATQTLDLVRRNTTSQFTVRAQASGSFPLRVRLESPEGLVLAQSVFTVRSTAVSGVGTALSIGAALFLLVWWGNHLRGRRSRRLVPGSFAS